MKTAIRQVSVIIIMLIAVLLATGGRATAQVSRVQYVYVANAVDGTVSAIDLTTNQVAWTVKIGERASHGIAASPDGKTVYASDATAREVVVIDADQRAVIKRIALSSAVHGIDISPDGKIVAVGGSLGDDSIKGSLSIINTKTLAIEDVVSPGLGAASHFAFTPNGKEIWVASTSTNLVWVVNAVTRQLAAAIPLSLPSTEQRPAPGDDWKAYLAGKRIIGLNEVAISNDGMRAYAVGPTTSELFAIDVMNRRVLKSVNAGQRAHGVTVSPDGKEVWIADWIGVVSVFDATSLKQLARIPIAETGGKLERGANHLAFSYDGRRVYVSSVSEVLVVDPKKRQILSRIAVGQEPHELSLEDWITPGARRSSGTSGSSSKNTPSQLAPPSPKSSNSSATTVVSGVGNELKRTNEERAVTLEVTPLNLTATGASLEFRIVMDTHSVELDGYDLGNLSFLRTEVGQSYEPTHVENKGGGHHRQVTLVFPRPSSEAKWLELVIKDIAGVKERIFRWDLKA